MRSSFLTDVKQEMPGWVARIYARQVAEGSASVYERLVDEVISRVGEVSRVIDVGCGPGHPSELLATRLPEAEVLGVDLSPVSIDIAQHSRSRLENLRFEVGNAMNLACPDGSFDAAVSFMSIKAWPGREEGVREMARAVRPGGWIAVFECDPDCSPEAAQNFCSLWRLNMGLSGATTARMGRAWYFRKFVAADGCRHDELAGFLRATGLKGVTSFSFADQPFSFAIGKKAG